MYKKRSHSVFIIVLIVFQTVFFSLVRARDSVGFEFSFPPGPYKEGNPQPANCSLVPSVFLPDGRELTAWEQPSQFSATYHVAQKHPNANDSNPETEEFPFRTINAATNAVQPGGRVLVHEGIYRELVRPPRGGSGPTAMISYVAKEGEDVINRESDVADPAKWEKSWLCSGMGDSSMAAVFQYVVPVVTTKTPASALLWIPSRALQVKGVVVAGMTSLEREITKDPRIRKVCADQQLAIIFLRCGLGTVDLQKVLDDLAKVSGYRELSDAPLMFIGHSAGGPQAKDLAIRMASRCFGLVLDRGGLPGGEKPVPAGVPTLMIVGQFDEFGGTMRNETGRETWENSRDGLVAFRSKNERNLASILVVPGAGHFVWSDRNAGYLAMWIHKAAHACIPETWSSDTKKPVALKKIDIESGWLTDLTIKSSGNFKTAPYKKYKGDKSKAAWHFDKEMAMANIFYHSGGFGRKDQFIKWIDPYYPDAGARFYFTDLKWIGDGQTLEVHPVYADKYPSPQPNGVGPKWFAAGKPAGHSDAPILVKKVGGPLVVTGPNTLRIQYDNLAPATEPINGSFIAYSIGDTEYRYTEQIGMLPRGFIGLNKGKDQIINFPAIGNLNKNTGSLELRATSDSGLPCEYYVAYGPAIVRDGKLIISEIPARASYPIEIKVVAYQFGSGVNPQIKTAVPVEQTILIEMP